MLERKAVLVVSHKGGTGKTLVAVNLAFRLKREGKKVALVDADVDSPNIIEFLKAKGELEVTEEKKLKPVVCNGIEVYSMGFFAKDKAISMRGSEYAEILKDVIEHGEWRAEYFIVDMCPGASDEFKRMVSIFGDYLLGSVIVGQPAHSLDTERVVKLHKLNGIPIIGIIENMSYFMCGNCKAKHPIFGESTVEGIAEKYGVPVLGKIPLSMSIREGVDAGRPFLSGKLGVSIKNAISRIFELKPKRPSFLAIVKEKIETLREKLVGVLSNLIIAANKEVDIPGLQEKYGFRGGRIIRLNAMDDEMERVIVRADFRVEKGKLVLVKKPRRIDVEIDMRPKALKWAWFGERELSNGAKEPYDFRDAWLLGDVEVYGSGDTIRAVDFFSGLWQEVKEKAGGKVERFLKVI